MTRKNLGSAPQGKKLGDAALSGSIESKDDAEARYHSVRDIYRRDVAALRDYSGDIPVPNQTISTILEDVSSFASRNDGELLALSKGAFASYFSKTAQFDTSKFPGSLLAIREQTALIFKKLVELQVANPDINQLTEMGATLVATSPFGSVQNLRILTLTGQLSATRSVALTMLEKAVEIAALQGSLGWEVHDRDAVYTNINPRDLYPDFVKYAQEGLMDQKAVISREKKNAREFLIANWSEIKEESARSAILFGTDPLEIVRQGMNKVKSGPAAMIDRSFASQERQREILETHQQFVEVAVTGRDFLSSHLSK